MENSSKDPMTFSEPEEQPISDNLPSPSGPITLEKEKSPSDKAKPPRESSFRVKSNHPKDNIIGI